MRWQAALTFKPLGALSLAKGAAIGMAVPPKILSVSLQHPDNWMEIQGEDVWLTLAGQRHLRVRAHRAAPNWHPVGASAEWRQQAQSMGWLVQMLGHPDWLEATALFESLVSSSKPAFVISCVRRPMCPMSLGKGLFQYCKCWDVCHKNMTSNFITGCENRHTQTLNFWHGLVSGGLAGLVTLVGFRRPMPFLRKL